MAMRQTVGRFARDCTLTIMHGQSTTARILFRFFLVLRHYVQTEESCALPAAALISDYAGKVNMGSNVHLDIIYRHATAVQVQWQIPRYGFWPTLPVARIGIVTLETEIFLLCRETEIL
jgi:hypothetical protein